MRVIGADKAAAITGPGKTLVVSKPQEKAKPPEKAAPAPDVSGLWGRFLQLFAHFATSALERHEAATKQRTAETKTAVKAITEALRDIQPRPRCAWKFTVTAYDGRGDPVTIIAEPVEKPE